MSSKALMTYEKEGIISFYFQFIYSYYKGDEFKELHDKLACLYD